MALIKGYSGSPDSARIVHSFQALAMRLGCKVWFEHVRSEANVADLPSRLDGEHAAEWTRVISVIKSRHTPLLLPPTAAFFEPFEQADAILAKAGISKTSQTSALKKRKRR